MRRGVGGRRGSGGVRWKKLCIQLSGVAAGTSEMKVLRKEEVETWAKISHVGGTREEQRQPGHGDETRDDIRIRRANLLRRFGKFKKRVEKCMRDVVWQTARDDARVCGKRQMQRRGKGSYDRRLQRRREEREQQTATLAESGEAKEVEPAAEVQSTVESARARSDETRLGMAIDQLEQGDATAFERPVARPQRRGFVFTYTEVAVERVQLRQTREPQGVGAVWEGAEEEKGLGERVWEHD